MFVMDAKEYLRRLARLDRRLDDLVERKWRYYDLAERQTAVYRDTPGTGRRCASSCEEYVCKIVDLDKEIDRQIGELVRLKFEADALIQCIANDQYRTILQCRYQKRWDWKKTAAAIHYQKRQAQRMHGWALREFEKILKFYTS